MRKAIRGRETFYLQWREGAKVKSQYVNKADVDNLREQIRRRHAIQEELVKLEAATKAESQKWNDEFESDVKLGDALRLFARTAEKWEPRDALKIRSNNPDVPTTIRVLFTQPGMRFAQAQALIHSLNKDRMFLSKSDMERLRVCNRIEQDVMGRMLEDIVLCETIRAIPYKRDKYKQLRVFKLVFDAGEYDMVVFDPEKLNCRLFEVKHTAERDDGQIRHLTDPEKLDWCTRNYGPILSRTVLYRGEFFDHPTGVAYRNVGEYLKGTGTWSARRIESSAHGTMMPIYKMEGVHDAID